MCVCFVLLLWALSLEYKIGQSDYADWMSFLPFNLMEEIIPNPEAHSANCLKPFISME